MEATPLVEKWLGASTPHSWIVGTILHYRNPGLPLLPGDPSKQPQRTSGVLTGVVVLSEHFFGKEWPQRELDGLVALEVDGVARIPPIWHKVSKDEVARFSPTLADKVALNTSLKSTAYIANELHSLLEL